MLISRVLLLEAFPDISVDDGLYAIKLVAVTSDVVLKPAVVAANCQKLDVFVKTKLLAKVILGTEDAFP